MAFRIRRGVKIYLSSEAPPKNTSTSSSTKSSTTTQQGVKKGAPGLQIKNHATRHVDYY